MPYKNISIIIPSYNGLELLKKSLPPLIEECHNYKAETEILVVDDGGTDDTYSRLTSLFPQISIIRKSVNEGFAKAVNFGVDHAKYLFLFLLNNDVEICPGILAQLSECFKDNNIFAVQAKMVSKDDEKDAINIYYSKYGFFIYKYAYIPKNTTQPIKMDFASGGASMIDKKKFIVLNMFDEKFSPAYFEDLDICFRSNLFGWQILYHPLAKAYHRHSGSTVKRKFSYFKRNLMHKRNYYLFIFKNLPLLGIFPLCFITIPSYAVYRLLKGDFWHIPGIFAAVYKHIFLKNIKRTNHNVMFVDSPLDPPGGGQISLLNIVSNLKSFNPFILLDKKTKMNELLCSKGIPHRTINISKLNIFFSVLKIIYFLRIIRPSLIHCNSATTFTTFVFAIVARIMHIPFIWHVRVTESAGWKDRLIARLATRIIAISQAVQNKFKINSTKIIKIHNAVDTNKFKPGIDISYLINELGIEKNALTIGIFSRLDWWKGHKIFLESIKNILCSSDSKNLSILIVGEGPEKSNIINSLPPNTVVTGFRKDIPHLMNICDVIVNPSTEPEPFGRTVIEAMSCGKTVIATDMGGHKEIIEDGINGFLVQPNAEKLAEKILYVLSNAELRNSIGLNARKKICSDFSINNHIIEIERLYGEITHE